MIGFLLLLITLFLINQFWLTKLKKKHSFLNKKLLNYLFWYHCLFFVIYYAYAQLYPSDSHQYFFITENTIYSWFEVTALKNWFIYMVAYPFVRILGFNYEMTMFYFSWLGYLGFIYSYLFFKEHIKLNIQLFKGVDFLTLLLFLPNMHFWTVSLGKGSIMFLGIMLFMYGLSMPKQRMVHLVISSITIFAIRPHIMFFILIGIIFGLITGREKIKVSNKFFMFIVAIGFVFLARNEVLKVVNLENSTNLVQDFGGFSTHITNELSRTSGSGVNMASYSIPVKLFTFWFRPLFFDAPGLLGIFTSIENLLYIFIFFKILNRRFITFVKRAPSIVKMAGITFFVTSLAMTFIMSNLGIIMRQKSMVMYMAFFVIMYFLVEEEKWKIHKFKSQIN